MKRLFYFAKSKTGVDYEALDGQPTYPFFMIAALKGLMIPIYKALAALPACWLIQNLLRN